VKLALAAEIVDRPGTVFSYNNKAVNLLAGIVKMASRKRLDNYLAEKIFAPMDIVDFYWTLDDEGNPHCMSGFQVLPKDLAKLGQLFVQKGRWNEQQLINEEWFTETGTPTALEPTCGLLWWIQYKKNYSIIDDEQINKLRQAGLPEIILNKIQSLKGRYSSPDFRKLFSERVTNTTPDWNVRYAPLLREKDMTVSRKEYDGKTGYATNGFLGNYLVVYPEKNLVVVRMISWDSFLKG
jgi:CubicO group peptidase (beta-lactamase class C family)